MPIYEFVCPECGLKFELLRPLYQARERTVCPRCHKSAERVLSTFASFSRGEVGLTIPLGGSSSCDSCSATSCDSCGL